MNRREALAAGGLAGVALGTGCAPRMIAPGGYDADAALADLDRSLAQARCIAPSFGGALSACAPGVVPADHVQETAARVAEICEEGARALMISAFFHELAPEERTHPVIQARMRSELPRIGNAVAAMVGAVEQVGPQERRAIQKFMRESPGLEDRILSEADGHASRFDAPFFKKVQFRRQVGDMAWRMRHQSVGVVIDEVVEKFHKAEAYQRAHAGEILAMARPPGQPPAAGPVLMDQSPGGTQTLVVQSSDGQENWWLPGTLITLVGLAAVGLGILGGTVIAGGNLGLATLALIIFSAGILVLTIGLLVLAFGGIARLMQTSQKSQPGAPAPGSPAPAPAPTPPPETTPL